MNEGQRFTNVDLSRTTQIVVHRHRRVDVAQWYFRTPLPCAALNLHDPHNSDKFRRDCKNGTRVLVHVLNTVGAGVSRSRPTKVNTVGLSRPSIVGVHPTLVQQLVLACSFWIWQKFLQARVVADPRCE